MYNILGYDSRAVHVPTQVCPSAVPPILCDVITIQLHSRSLIVSLLTFRLVGEISLVFIHSDGRMIPYHVLMCTPNRSSNTTSHRLWVDTPFTSTERTRVLLSFLFQARARLIVFPFLHSIPPKPQHLLRPPFLLIFRRRYHHPCC